MKLSYDPTTPLLGIYPEKTIIEKDTCTPVFIATLFTISRSSTDEWIKKLWYVYIMEYYSAMEKNALESVPMST